jgi:hypothetical protein
MVWGSNPGGEKNFLFSKMPRQGLEPTQPSIKEYQDTFPALNWLGLEVGHWRSSSAKFSEELYLFSRCTPS